MRWGFKDGGNEHVHKYEAVLWTLEKLRKTIFCYLQNDQFFTKGVEIFRKGLHRQKLKKSFRYKKW